MSMSKPNTCDENRLKIIYIYIYTGMYVFFISILPYLCMINQRSIYTCSCFMIVEI